MFADKTLKVAAIVVALTLLVAPASSARGKKKAPRVERTISVEYQAPGGIAPPMISVEACINGSGCFEIGAEQNENYISLAAEDATGTPTPFVAVVNDGTYEICGQTTQPIWLNGAKRIELRVYAARPPDCSGVASTGAITVTFSNLP